MKKIIRKWLGITEFEKELEKTRNLYTELDIRHSALLKRHNGLAGDVVGLKRPQYLLERIDSGIKNLEDIRDSFGLGADISPNKFDESWAVICMSGKQDIVKFARLDNKSLMEISGFLRRYEFKHQRLDLPAGFRL
jgi:hypothetical protein